MSGGNEGRPDGDGQESDRSSGVRDESRERPQRSLAEWVTLGISLAIVFGLLGLVTYLFLDDGQANPVIEVTLRVEETRRSGDRYYVPVEISNTGGRTVEQLQVTVALALPDGSTEDANFTVDFLAGGATEEGVASFSEDPTEHEVSVGAVSYVEP